MTTRSVARIPLVDLKAQYAAIKPSVNAAIQRVLDHTGFILGEEVAAFEREFAAYVDAPEAVGVSSGTSALHLALLAGGAGPGTEVITTAHTFIATAEAISHTGATPVFVDIDPVTYAIHPARIEAAITPRTRAIVPVHLYGRAADMDAILAIARRHQLLVIEDAAQAHGAEHRGRRCGSIGDLACFSFYPGKNLGAYGDAGAVTGLRTDLLQTVRRLRDHGRTTKYEHEQIGFGARIDALQAAVLRAKLPYLEEWTEARRRHAAQYRAALQGLPLVLPADDEHGRHVYHLFVARSEQRDALLKHLKGCGVDAGIHYPVPLHRQPVYLQQGFGSCVLPETEKAAREVFSLPLYPELETESIALVAEAVREFFACQ